MSKSNSIYIIYRTTNLVNQKIYIGVHKQKFHFPVLFDGYLGSGKHLKKAIKKYGAECFSRETLFVYYTPEEAFAKEAELVNEAFVNRKDTYNLCCGGKGDRNKRKCSLETKQKISDSAKNKVMVKNKYNNKFRVSKDDPRYISGELVGIRKGVKFTDDQRKNISDGLKNQITVIDKNGKCFNIFKDDPRYISGELKSNLLSYQWSEEQMKLKRERMIEINNSKKGGKLSEEHKQKIGDVQRGKTVSEETKQKISQTKQNKPIIVCPHCGKIGKESSAMKRYHFNNCKSRKLSD